MKSQEFRHACKNCSLSSLCLPVGLSARELQQLDAIVQKQKVVQKGEFLVRMGQKFTGLFAVHSGSFKAFQSGAVGQEKVMGFYLPGELFGFNAIYPQQYTLSLQALEVSSVCELSYEGLLELARELPVLQNQLMALMSQQLSQNQRINRQATAEQNIAAFLLDLSARLQKRGLSPYKFMLTMSRQDIANYLGLANETVSRLFKRLQAAGVIDVNRREIELVNIRELQIMMCGDVT